MKQSIPAWEKSLNTLDPVSIHMLNRYIKLIKYAKTLSVTECRERHHIIPKSMGGTDAGANLVVLTPRLHYLAHYMLWKAFKNRQMAYAFHIMIHGNPHHTRYTKVSSRDYDSLITECRELNKGISNPVYGKKKSEESKVNQRNAVKGKKWSEERRQERSKLLLDKYKKNPRKPTSDATKQKISKANKGKPKPFTEAHKAALHIHVLNKQISTCPHCGKTAQGLNMKRWHFDNCKLRPQPLVVATK